MILKKKEEDVRRKELQETQKCEEEVARRRNLSAARAELEIKHFEEKQGKMPILGPFVLSRSLVSCFNLLYDELSHEEMYQRQGFGGSETTGDERV